VSRFLAQSDFPTNTSASAAEGPPVVRVQRPGIIGR